MPAVYTHYAVAREAWKSLPLELQEKLRAHLSVYFFGANGPDFCFFYKFLEPKPNLGSFLHHKGSLHSFQVLKAFSLSSPLTLAYALGFITHYATDVVFHPVVYKTSKKSLLKHTRIENAIDGYFKGSSKENLDPYRRFYRTKLSDGEKSELFFLFSAIAAKCDLPPLVKSSFFRAIQRFHAYLPMPNAFFGQEKDWGDVEIKEGEPERKIADELFVRSVAFACELMEVFLEHVETRTALPEDLFGKNYLTGEPVAKNKR